MPNRKDFLAIIAKYSETPVFSEETTPSKLTSVHDTKQGVWGKLVVLAGEIDYIVPGRPPARASHAVELRRDRTGRAASRRVDRAGTVQG